MSKSTTALRGISERNRRLLTLLHQETTGPFSAEEAARALSLTIPRAQRFLAYLAERGWLVRIHRGLYAPVPLDASKPHEWRTDPWIAAAKLFGPAYYIDGWSACEHWNLTEQIFRATVVVTTRRVRHSRQEIQGFPFRIKRAGEGRMFGLKRVWRDQIAVNLSDPARTLVDILDDPTLGGGLRQIGDILGVYFDSEHRDDALVATYAQQLGNGAVYKRLGYLLEAMDISAPALIEACTLGISAGDSLLDPSLPRQGKIARRWNLRINGNVQSEDGAL